MNENIISKLSAIVPEFWHDLIARIVPGFLILYSVKGNFIGILKGVSFIDLLGELLLSYSIGITVDILSDAAFCIMPWYQNKREEFYKKLDKHESQYRKLLVKMFAEVVFFRSLSFYLFVQSFFSICVCNKLPLNIENMILPWYLSLVLFVVFTICFVRMMDNAHQRLDVDKNTGLDCLAP
ncbi:membrane hypothetical protein [Gammaproteobacteria bacterium]